MIHIKDFINEKLIINKDSETRKYKYFPKTKEELKQILYKKIISEEDGPNSNLNDIDISGVNDLSMLFIDFKDKIENIDISKWNVSRVRNMRNMFNGCKKFNCDLSKWNVSHVTDMKGMFCRCESFSSDISSWDVSKVKNMSNMLQKCEKFNCDISKWDVSHCEEFEAMLSGCINLSCNLENWKVNSNELSYMLKNCDKIMKPSWYKEWEKNQNED